MTGKTKPETKATEKKAPAAATKASVDKLRERFDKLELFVRMNNGYNPHEG